MSASKSYNDVHPHSYEWAEEISGALFGLTDLLAFEREFLGWLDYNTIAANEEHCTMVQRKLYQLLDSTRPAHDALTPPCFRSLFDIAHPLESEQPSIFGPTICEWGREQEPELERPKIPVLPEELREGWELYLKNFYTGENKRRIDSMTDAEVDAFWAQPMSTVESLQPDYIPTKALSLEELEVLRNEALEELNKAAQEPLQPLHFCVDPIADHPPHPLHHPIQEANVDAPVDVSYGECVAVVNPLLDPVSPTPTTVVSTTTGTASRGDVYSPRSRGPDINTAANIDCEVSTMATDGTLLTLPPPLPSNGTIVNALPSGRRISRQYHRRRALALAGVSEPRASAVGVPRRSPRKTKAKAVAS